MTPLEELAAGRLSRAEEALRDGTYLMENGSWRAAVNRFYYACFHSARALLATRDRDSKTHSGVIALFHEEFVRTDQFDRQVARALSRAFERRQESDYSDLAEPKKTDAEASLEDAARFVAECRRLLTS